MKMFKLFSPLSVCLANECMALVIAGNLPIYMQYALHLIYYAVIALIPRDDRIQKILFKT